jgi:uncharacterized protein (TIRG00374 family)
VLVAIAVTAAAYALVFGGTSLPGLSAQLKGIELRWLLAAVGSMFLLQALRLLRWGLLVSAVATVPPGAIVRIGSIGTMAVDILPLRLGEMVRPALLDRRAGVPFVAGAATVLVERLLDVLALLSILGLALAFAELPTEGTSMVGWNLDLLLGRNILLGMVALLLLPILGILIARETTLKVVEAVLRLFPGGTGTQALAWTRTFADGVQKISRPKSLLMNYLLSLIIWMVSVLIAWTLLQAFDKTQLGIVEAAVVTLFVAIALLMPAPVGGLGVFEAGAVVGLGLYGVDGDPAALYAVTLHSVHLGTITLLGLVCLLWEGIGWRDLTKQR